MQYTWLKILQMFNFKIKHPHTFEKKHIIKVSLIYALLQKAVIKYINIFSLFL